jgi:predicted ester cyclase
MVFGQKRKKKRSTKKKKKGIEALDKSLKSKKRTKLGKSVNVNLRNVNRTLGSSTFFN